MNCASDRVTVEVAGDDPAAVAAPWRASIESQGFSVVEDGSRDGWVNVRYADESGPLVLAAWSTGGAVTVSVVSR